MNLEEKRFSLDAEKEKDRQTNNKIGKNLNLLTETTKLLGTFLSNNMENKTQNQIMEMERLCKEIEDLQNLGPEIQ